MKIKLLFSVICGLTLAVSVYSENIKLNNGTEYTNITVVGSDGISIKVEHDKGTSRIKYYDLSPDLKQKYGYSAEKEQEYYRKAATEKQALAEQNAQKAEAERKKAEEQRALILKLNSETTAFLEKGSLCVFKSTFYTDIAGKQYVNKEDGILAIEYNNYLLLENGNFVRGGFYTAETVVQYLLTPRNKRVNEDFKNALLDAVNTIQNYGAYNNMRKLCTSLVSHYNEMVEANRKALADRKQYDVNLNNGSYVTVTTVLNSNDYKSLNTVYTNNSNNVTGTIVETTPLPYSYDYMLNEYRKIFKLCSAMDEYSNSVQNNLSRISQGAETYGGVKMNSAYAALTRFYRTGDFGKYHTNTPCIKTAESDIIKEFEQLFASKDVQNILKDLSRINKEVTLPDNVSRKLNTP